MYMYTVLIHRVPWPPFCLMASAAHPFSFLPSRGPPSYYIVCHGPCMQEPGRAWQLGSGSDPWLAGFQTLLEQASSTHLSTPRIRCCKWVVHVAAPDRLSARELGVSHPSSQFYVQLVFFWPPCCATISSYIRIMKDRSTHVAKQQVQKKERKKWLRKRNKMQKKNAYFQRSNYYHAGGER